LILFVLPEDGFDRTGTPPRESKGPLFQWVQERQELRWPASVKVRLPENTDLRLLAIVDVDGNGRLSPGDYLSQPLSVAEVTGPSGSSASFPIDQMLSAHPTPPQHNGVLLIPIGPTDVGAKLGPLTQSGGESSKTKNE
jgi:hypothetical protein